MGRFVEVTAKTLRNEPAHYSFRAGFNAKGVASQSPGLNAAFYVQLWDRIHLHLYPVRIVSRRNPYRIDSAFEFSPGLAKSTPTLGFETLPRWGRMHRIFRLNCRAMTSVSRVGNSQGRAGGFRKPPGFVQRPNAIAYQPRVGRAFCGLPWEGIDDAINPE